MDEQETQSKQSLSVWWESRIPTGLVFRVWFLVLDGDDGEGSKEIKVLMNSGILQVYNINTH